MTIDYNNALFNTGSFFLYDSNTMPFHPAGHASHFALTDALITYAGAKEKPLIHFWQTTPLIILGMMDTKITHFYDALDVFKQYDHEYIVRNSGGLAVVSDPGVLNVSLFYPSKTHRLTIDQAYQFMLDFVQATFEDFPKKIEAYEISQSYCFGDYDLSIDGRKIAGVSQRRIKDGVAVMLYISVNGNQEKRAQLIKDFYTKGLDGSEPAGRYPNVDPSVMTTLEDALGQSFQVNEIKERMLTHFNWQDGTYTEEIQHAFDEGLEKMIKRNQRVFGNTFPTKK